MKIGLRFLLSLPVFLVFLCLCGSVAVAQVGPCVGDCDGDGVVRVQELTGVVGIALGEVAEEICPGVVGEVDVAILVRAVRHALDGCPAELTEDSLRQVARVTRVAAAVVLDLAETINWPNANGGQTCPLGGSDARGCDVLDDGLARIPFDFQGCTHAAEGGVAVQLDGDLALIGTGFCPGVFLPANVRLDMDLTTTLASAEDEPLREADIALSGLLDVLDFAPGGCLLAGLTASTAGAVTELREGIEIHGIRFSGMTFALAYGFLDGRCRSVFSTFALDGDLELRDAAGVLDLTANDLVLTQTEGFRTGIMLGLDGRIRLAGAEGTVRIRTESPLPIRLDDPCPRDGELRVEGVDRTGVARFLADGAVEIDLDGDGSVEAVMDGCGAG